MVSIVILTYNSEKYIDGLLTSLIDFSKDAEIIIVDNASTDKTVSLVKKFGKSVRLVETGSNLGFAAGNNKGAKVARGEYLLFINPDAKFESGNLNGMTTIFEQNEMVGLVGGKLIGRDGKPEKSAGKFFGLLASILIATGFDEKFGVRISPSKTSKVDFVSGGFMMIKRELYAHLKGFDEHFFMYIEDMELCFRAKLAGYSTYFTPDVVITHVGQGSSNRGFAVKNIVKGILYFHKKHGTPFSYFMVKFLFKIKALILVLAGYMMNNKYLTDTYSAVLKE